MKKQTVTKTDLVEMGFPLHTSQELVRQAKLDMVKQGYEFYQNRRLGRVPVRAVEAILGVSLEEKGA